MRTLTEADIAKMRRAAVVLHGDGLVSICDCVIIYPGKTLATFGPIGPKYHNCVWVHLRPKWYDLREWWRILKLVRKYTSPAPRPTMKQLDQ